MFCLVKKIVDKLVDNGDELIIDKLPDLFIVFNKINSWISRWIKNNVKKYFNYFFIKIAVIKLRKMTSY